MDRREEHVAAAIENILRAVAVMIVDVENRRTQARIDQPLCRNGDIVEIAIAAEHVRARVMSRRTGQGEGRALALSDRVRGRKRDIGARARGVPGSLRDRRRGIEGVCAELGVDIAFPALAKAARGPYRRVSVRAAGLGITLR